MKAADRQRLAELVTYAKELRRRTPIVAASSSLPAEEWRTLERLMDTCFLDMNATTIDAVLAQGERMIGMGGS